MNIFFSDDFILGVAIGIAIACCALYILLRVESQILLRRINRKVKKWPLFIKTEEEAEFTTPIKSPPLHPIKNLNKETIYLDPKLVLEMLQRNRRTPTQELKLELHTHLLRHSAEGNNFLHEYLRHTEAPELELVREVLEISPEILLEENAHGETALHIAEKHHHFEIAEELAEEKHFSGHAQHAHFLKHADHHGHTALHELAHLWHITHVAQEMLHDLEHLIHMLEKHPPAALSWKDKEGKTVQEILLDMDEHQKKLFVETLMHKGILTKEHDHLVVHPLLKEKLHINTGSSYHNLTTLAELYLNSYPHYVHENTKDLHTKQQYIHPHLP